jgi:hypothetical protein
MRVSFITVYLSSFPLRLLETTPASLLQRRVNGCAYLTTYANAPLSHDCLLQVFQFTPLHGEPAHLDEQMLTLAHLYESAPFSYSFIL